jgi:hypothetical protein
VPIYEFRKRGAAPGRAAAQCPSPSTRRLVTDAAALAHEARPELVKGGLRDTSEDDQPSALLNGILIGVKLDLARSE